MNEKPVDADTMTVPVDAGQQPPEAQTAAEPHEELVLEDLLVEEVSIDGMCGVY